MAVRIRMKRMGAKKRPFYRVVVADSRAARNGRFIDTLGFYNPISKDELSIDADKAVDWLLKGAQPSDTVRALLQKTGVMEKFVEARAEANQ